MQEHSTAPIAHGHATGDPWWRNAVIYQVYSRSFADGDGDGIGDLAGLLARLPYLARLGVDAIWLTPVYPSPMADGGYDVADYRDIDPVYGTLGDAETLIARAHALGLRVLFDIVPNHTSSAHPWFRAALRGDADARDRYWFRPGRGPEGGLPPNDWESIFGGPAWTRVDDGRWYLHLFASSQPDLNWNHPAVRADFERTLRFWFDRGLDGFRIDVAHGLVKDPALPDAGKRIVGFDRISDHPAWDQDGTADIYRSWRRIADSYSPPRIFVGEIHVCDNARLARYLRPGLLHTAFQMDLLRSSWRAAPLRAVVEDAVGQAAAVGASPAWVLANHDVTRIVTRYARSQPGAEIDSEWDRTRWTRETPDHDLGRRRARAAALLQLALPGCAYLYQGDELGLEEVEDLPGDIRQDPTWAQSGYTDVGRDGCRVPIPWSGDAPPYGFSPDHAERSPWLPQPAAWADRTVAAQDSDRGSFLTLYRTALALRRVYWADAAAIRWLDTPPGALAFTNGAAQCWVNTGDRAVELPGLPVALASPPVIDRLLPPDGSAWLIDRPRPDPIRRE
ncbi:glycoside hydrolase family 13 protein [Nocardia mexicana]|uniref:Alpha-glucosidase n=1 Tax=Nocardia mexicana TaxID=279262 RepID=A0A370H4L0_9NOCA|nr:glycoside hydrolase family 13 protein [Nocardia mexicana]RDI48966.1 alpha-glucosidase [Nocardia mexicana]